MPTVAQVWRQTMPEGTEIAAGKQGLFDEVSWVVTLRPTPPGFDRLRGNELALIDAATARKLGVSSLSLVMSLAEQGAGSIGFLGELSPDVIEFAQQENLPLLVIPPENDLLQVESRITNLIREERDSIYSQEQEITSVLMKMALAGSGVNAIIGKLSDLSGRTIVLFDTNFEPLSMSPDKTVAELKKVLLKLFPLPPSSIKGLNLDEKVSVFISPVSGKQRTEGFLLVLAPSAELQESDRMLAKVGALALAIELSRRHAVEDTEDRFQVEMLESLLTGDLSSAAAADRAGRLGLNLSQRYTVIVMQSPALPETGINPKRVKSVLGGKVLCFDRGSSLIIVLEVAKHSIDEMRGLKRETARRLSGYFGTGITLGMGRSYIASEGLGLSLTEAEQALTIGRQLFGNGSASFFGDLGIYRLLLSINIDELKGFYNESLELLDDYDREHGGELIRTLEEILKYPTLTETAQALHVHRNTLLYRIQRIQEITNLNLDDGETRLIFHLALKVRDVIRRN